MLLADKIAVVYRAAGSIGSAIAGAFAREGASVHLGGRTAATLDSVATDIRVCCGRAETAVVDALDEHAVDAFVDDVMRWAGGSGRTPSLSSSTEPSAAPASKAMVSPQAVYRPDSTAP